MANRWRQRRWSTNDNGPRIARTTLGKSADGIDAMGGGPQRLVATQSTNLGLFT